MLHNVTLRYRYMPFKLHPFEERFMNNNCAELVDTMNKRLAIGFLVVSMAYAFEVLSFLVGEPLKGYSKQAGDIFAVLSMVVVLFAMWPVLKRQVTNPQIKNHEEESFITDALHTSIRISWMITLFCLMFMMAMDNLRAKLNLPVDFYFKLLFFIMMFTVGIGFFLKTRDESMELSQ